MRTPVRPIERIARVEYPLAANQRSDEVDVELLKRAVVHQQNYGFDVPAISLRMDPSGGASGCSEDAHLEPVRLPQRAVDRVSCIEHPLVVHE